MLLHRRGHGAGVLRPPGHVGERFGGGAEHIGQFLRDLDRLCVLRGQGLEIDIRPGVEIPDIADGVINTRDRFGSTLIL